MRLWPWLVLLCACCLAREQEVAQPGGRKAATIQIVEGDGAINSIRLHRAHDPVVRVLGPDGEPGRGATVTFLLPARGASGSFGESGLSITVQADNGGVAVGRGLRPNNVAGQFQIRVITSWNGAASSATLSQTNAEPVAHAGRSKRIAIMALVAGAAIGGVAAAAAHKSGSSSQTPSSSPPGSIASGNPSIGPPN